MVLRPPLDGDPGLLRNLYGVALNLIPGDASLPIEVQRAPDSAGAPNVGSAVSLGSCGPFPLGGGVYFDPRPANASVWWYRARHISDAFDSGDWTNWVSSAPYLVRQADLDAALNNPTYPLPYRITLGGDPRPVLANRDTALIINPDFEVWERYD